MFIISKRRVILPSRDGTRSHLVPRDYIGEIPDWAADTDYFRSLVMMGKLVCLKAARTKTPRRPPRSRSRSGAAPKPPKSKKGGTAGCTSMETPSFMESGPLPPISASRRATTRRRCSGRLPAVLHSRNRRNPGGLPGSIHHVDGDHQHGQCLRAAGQVA